MARIPLTRLEPMDGQRPLIQATLDGIYNSLCEDNASMRDVHPLGVIVAKGNAMEDFKGRLKEQNLDRVLSFEGIPEEYRLKVYSGFHRFTAATRYVEAHGDDPEPPSAAMRSWLCAVYDAAVADDPDLPVLMVAHNIEGIRSAASIKEWIHSLQFSGSDPARIKTAIGLTAQGATVANLFIVRSSMLWEPLVTYGTSEFNQTLSVSIIASWAGYCAEFEILKILLEDAVRQQDHIATLKKGNMPLTPFDIFGQAWGENGHKQSGEMENVRKDWERAKIHGFGTGKSTLSFGSFWKKAVLDEKAGWYLFGHVILVPEDLRGDPKGGKRKDMAGYVILTRARAALSCLSALLFAGDFEYRCMRTASTIPEPWVATIMEKQGVDKRHVEEFIRDLVCKLDALVTENQVKGELPHQAAHDIFKKKGHSDEALHQMVWTEVIDQDCCAAWEEFLLHCEEKFKFERNKELWVIITKVSDAKTLAKAATRKSERQKGTQAAAVVDDKVLPTKKGGSGGKKHQTPPSSSDSDKEVVIKTRRRGAGKKSTSEGNPIPQKSRQSERISARMTSRLVVEDDEDSDNEEGEVEAEAEAEVEDDEDEDEDDGIDESEEQPVDSIRRFNKHVDDSDTDMEDDPYKDSAMDENGGVPDDGDVAMTYHGDEDKASGGDNDHDERTTSPHRSSRDDDGVSMDEDPNPSAANSDEENDEVQHEASPMKADQPRGYSVLTSPTSPSVNPSQAMIGKGALATGLTATFNTSALRSGLEVSTLATASSTANQTAATARAASSVRMMPPTSAMMSADSTVLTRKTPLIQDKPAVQSENLNRDRLDLELCAARASIDSELTRWRDAGRGSEALELIKSLHIQLLLGP